MWFSPLAPAHGCLRRKSASALRTFPLDRVAGEATFGRGRSWRRFLQMFWLGVRVWLKRK
jgi:hypothetical protein